MPKTRLALSVLIVGVALSAPGFSLAQDAKPNIDGFKSKVAEAREELAHAQRAARDKLPQVPEYQQAKVAVDEAKEQMAHAKADREFNAYDKALNNRVGADKRLKSIGDKLIASDPGVKAAMAGVEAAELRLANGIAAEKARRAAIEAKIPANVRAYLDAEKSKRVGYLLPEKIKVGDIGRVQSSFIVTARILQVIDENNVLVALSTHFRDSFQDQTVWVTGYSTKGLADHTDFKPNEIFEATKTTAYESKGGPTTVIVLKPIDLAPYRAMRK